MSIILCMYVSMSSVSYTTSLCVSVCVSTTLSVCVCVSSCCMCVCVSLCCCVSVYATRTGLSSAVGMLYTVCLVNRLSSSSRVSYSGVPYQIATVPLPSAWDMLFSACANCPSVCEVARIASPTLRIACDASSAVQPILPSAS